ncbi:MAG: tRNA (adenosine(37)-N6)-dimethylallyltransferase MiaA [Thermomicrobiales bacterium]
MPPLIVIAGPTAVGKTAAAIALALRHNGEIVSADSRQVYRGLDIGTAKPTPDELAAVPHHLLDIREPDEPFSLADYVALARTAIVGIHARGHLPILAGGTPLYLNAVVEGWRVPSAPPDLALRTKLEQEAAAHGLAALEARLAAVDPVAAGRARGNARRVVRALEVYMLTGQPMSAQEGKEPPPYHIWQAVLTLDRAALHARIDARVERMIAAGLVEEVRALLERGYAPDLPALSGIGYAEIVAYLRGESTLPDAIARIKTNTHRYVRHQETWFRRNHAAERSDVAVPDWLNRLDARVNEMTGGR